PPNQRHPDIPILQRKRQLRTAMLAIRHGDRQNCAYAARWLSGRSLTMCLVVQLPPAITTARAFRLNRRLPFRYVMTTWGACAGFPAWTTLTTVAFSRIRVAWPARSKAAN